MAISFPSNAVWFVRASAPGLEPQEGSAIAVRLRPRGSKGPFQNYLLTSAHVIRREGSNKNFLGKPYPQLRTWEPGSGYDPVRGQTVEIVRAVVPDATAAADFYDGECPAVDFTDWVLLSFTNAKVANRQNLPVVQTWLAEPADHTRCRVIGYPGGEAGFVGDGDANTNVVTPVASPSDFEVKVGNQPIVELTGSQTRAGMSGGGIFVERTNELIGLHRAREDDSLELRGVSAGQIRPIIEGQYEFAPPTKPKSDLFFEWIIESVPASLAGPIRFLAAAMSSTYRRYAALTTTGAMAIALVVFWPFGKKPDPVIETLAASTSEVTIEAELMRPVGNKFVQSPLTGATITAIPFEFKSDSITTNPTDAEGRTVITIRHSDKGKPKAHFLVENVPPEWKDLGPLVALKFGAVRIESGDLIFPSKSKAKELAASVELPLTIIPYRQLAKVAEAEVASQAIAQSKESGTPSPTSESLAKATGYDDELVQAALKTWSTRLRDTHPAIAADKIATAAKPGGVAEWDKLKQLAPEIAASVCCILDERGELLGTGFVIAKDLVLTADFVEASKAKSVGFWPSARDRTTPPNLIAETVFRHAPTHTALLKCPGLTARGIKSLAIAGNLPYPATEARPIAVFGYTAADGRLPEEVQALHTEGGDRRKRIMPGESFGVRGNGPTTVFENDALTSGGASGGPVIDLKTGLVVGMHVTGRWVGSDSKLNQAVPIWSILRVPEVAAIVTRENATIRNSMSVAAVRSGTGETLSGYDPAFLPGIRIALPTSAARLDVLPYTHFSVAMGTDRSLATYAAFQIDRTRTQTVPRSGTDNYTFDTRLSVDRQRGSDLYTANDWDRGHLAFRSAVLWGTPEEAKAAAEQVNTYTNIAPQDKDFNQKTWFALERFVLDQYVPASKRVSVFVGPVFDERDTFYRGAKIPAAFWMVAVAIDPTKPGIPQVKAWMASQYDMKNGLIVVRPGERDIVRRNVVTVAAIEAVTKLTFDPALRSGATPP